MKFIRVYIAIKNISIKKKMDVMGKNIEESFEKFGGLYAWSTSIFILQLLALTWFTGRIRVRTQVNINIKKFF